MTPVHDVFCDYLDITTPEDDWPALRDLIRPLLDEVGAILRASTAGRDLWQLGESGTVEATHRRNVVRLSHSGSGLAHLRAAGLFLAYLAEIGTVPHRVTRLDATLDVETPTPPVLRRLSARIKANALQVTRKRVSAQHVTRWTDLRDPRSGTMYIGPPRADVRPVIYDKQLERLGRGHPDPGVLTRYECRLRHRVGITLRDAAEPAPVFYHFMAPQIIEAPPGIRKWNPQDNGYSLPRRDPITPAARLVRRLEGNPDLLNSLELAATLGPAGTTLVHRTIDRLIRQRGAGDTPAETLPPSVASQLSVTRGHPPQPTP